ncbi:MAG: winged helix-turn-helix transcriptional regulator [Bacteroidales bacterium]|nr:winged helix-turn-helix transcriptional regulator [Bacteroidales bacterium]
MIALCEYVFVNPTSTAKEIASHLGVSEPTVNRYIRSLRDLGVITRNGARKNGHWILNPQ